MIIFWGQILRNWTFFLGGGFKHFCFYLYLGRWSNFTNIFQMGWNHHLGFFPIRHDASFPKWGRHLELPTFVGDKMWFVFFAPGTGWVYHRKRMETLIVFLFMGTRNLLIDIPYCHWPNEQPGKWLMFSRDFHLEKHWEWEFLLDS